jgi:hypothetical protein
MDDGRAVDEADHGRAKIAAIALLSIAGAFVLGWGLIRMVDALEPGDGCGAYGYGGYGCPVDWKITVEPSTDLVDRQTVTVRGTGFSANTTFGAAQCDPTVGPDAGTEGCDLSTARTTTTDGNGDVQIDLQVRRIIIVQGREVDCALSPCTIGAATLSGSTPIEATSLPISFDPSVPPVPRLEVSMTVDDVTTSQATGTVTCNRSADAFLEVAVQQTKGNSQASAYGFAGSIACDVAPSPWTVRFTEGDGVLRGGLATYAAFASAYDGFDSADAQQSGEVKVAGGGGPTFDPVDNPGETVSVEVVGATSGADGLLVNLLVDCDRPVPDGLAFVSVSQRVGLKTATGFGFVDFGACDGPTTVSVPISPGAGSLAGGPAEVTAEVQIADFDDPAGEFFDYASTTAAVRLPGSRPTKPAPVVPNPASRIAITGSTRSALSGTVTCEEPALVELFVEVRQTKGRTSSSGFGYSVITCSGTTAFEVPLDGDLGSGAADSFVYATGYREIEGGDDYEYLWDDHQAATLRIGH